MRVQTIKELGEFGIIGRIRDKFPGTEDSVVLGIGDDSAALIPTKGRITLASCDIQVEGQHFERKHVSARELGIRSAAVNLSDIAAMGGVPRHALVSLALPIDLQVSWLDEFYDGLSDELRRFGAGVVGGNLSKSLSQIIIDITILGEVVQAVMLTRGGARVGDAVLVTGDLGGSMVGRLAMERSVDLSEEDVELVAQKYLTPQARGFEGQTIAKSRLATSMIDVSDGLASDLGHLCAESRVGAQIEVSSIPLDASTISVAHRLNIDPMEAALYGGEDYQLLFTCTEQNVKSLIDQIGESTGTVVHEIGVINDTDQLTLVQRNGSTESITVKGWDHFK